MLIDRMASRESTREVRDHLLAGHRDVELTLGPRVREGAVLVDRGARTTVKAEVEHGRLVAARMPSTHDASLFSAGLMDLPTVFVGEIDTAAGLARGTVATALPFAFGSQQLAGGVVMGIGAGFGLGLLVSPVLGVVAFLVLAALGWYVGRGAPRRTAAIVQADLWRIAALVGSAEPAASGAGPAAGATGSVAT